jgi:hypothetical protein
MFAMITRFFSRPQVLIHGRHSGWMRALGPRGGIWGQLGDYDVGRSYRLGILPTWRRRYVVPMFEHHVQSMPRPSWAFVPNRAARRAFSDKGCFARFVVAHQLSTFAPVIYEPSGCTNFPAVLKRVDLNGSSGVAIVRSAQELAEQLRDPFWANHRTVLQEFIPGMRDKTLHAVAVEGRIVWHCAYEYDLASSDSLRPPPQETRPRKSEISPADLAILEQFLLPFAYNGPLCIDYKHRSDGRLAVIEINPRFGGSLMRPEYVNDLAAAMRHVLANARLYRPGEDDF